MDWNTEEGRALLLQAYPDGFLLAPGLATVGGWRCLHVVPGNVAARIRGNVWWGDFGPHRKASTFPAPAEIFTFPAFVRMALNADGSWRDRVKQGEEGSGDAATLRRAVKQGDLLPLPDRNDPATWACLMADLWQAMGGRVPHGGLALDAPYSGERWEILAGSLEGDLFDLDLPVGYGDSEGQTRDPELAVVLARIHYRKLGK